MDRSRGFSMLLLALVAVVALGGAYLAYDTFLRGDAVAPLALPSAEPTSAQTAAPTASGATADPPTTAPDTVGDPTGPWSMADGSMAGYRVREQLANLPAESDAVGRTAEVFGTITLARDGDGLRVTDGTVTVDTTTITSDESRRDDRMRTEGLETDRYPSATFQVTEPVTIPVVALEGTPADVTLVGDLTLHGVTRAVTIPAQAQLVDGRIQVAGSLTFALADFEITAPNVGGFIVSIADEGTLEFLLVLGRD